MVLTSEQLNKIWNCFFEKKDAFSRSLLITHYSYLVKITVSRLRANLPGGIDREDLIGAGIIGLIKSVEQFDPLRDIKFETYAIALIRGAVLEMLREEDWVPRSIREKLRALDRAQSLIEVQMGRSPTTRELSEHLGLTDQEVHVLQSRMKKTTVFSLDDTVQMHDSDDNIHFIELVVDENTNPLTEIEGREIRKALHLGIDTLPDRERIVITLYYYESLTFREIGKVLGVSESRVYQLHNQAMNRLKGYLREQSIIKVA